MCFARVIFPKYYLQQQVKLQDCTWSTIAHVLSTYSYFRIPPVWLVVSFSSGQGVLRSSSLRICISVPYDGSHGWHLQTTKDTRFQDTLYRHTESRCNDWQDETNICPLLWQMFLRLPLCVFVKTNEKQHRHKRNYRLHQLCVFPALRELCSWVSNVIHVWLA